MNSTVCIYILNHNYGKYLERAVKSVYDQSVQPTQIILIDDGSTDKETIESIKRIKHTYPSCNIYERENCGLIKSSNFALSLCKCDYIIRLDADDYLEAEAIEKLTKKITEDDNTAICFGNYYEIDTEGSHLRLVQRLNFEKDVELYDIPAHGACTLFAHKALMDVGGYDETISCQDGWDIWLKLSASYKITNVKEVVFYYTKHSRSLSSNKFKILDARCNIIKREVTRRGLNTGKVAAVIPLCPSYGMDEQELAMTCIKDKPLITYMIESAQRCNVEKIIILTKNVQVWSADLLEQHPKVELFERGSLNNLSIESASAALYEYAMINKFDKYVVLNLLYPFTSPKYIEKAIHCLECFNINSVVSVLKDDSIFYRHLGKGLVNIRSNEIKRYERDDIFRRAGGINCATYETIVNTRSLTGGILGHIIIDDYALFKYEGYINTMIVDQVAEAYLKHDYK